MIDNLSIEVYAFVCRILMPFPAILNKSWQQHPTRHQLYGHLPPITKTIQVRRRRTRQATNYWRSKNEHISNVHMDTFTQTCKCWTIYIYIYVCVCKSKKWEVSDRTTAVLLDVAYQQQFCTDIHMVEFTRPRFRKDAVYFIRIV